MVTDDDVLVEDDLYILDRIKEFLLHPEVSTAPAAKTLLNIIERKVSNESKCIPDHVLSEFIRSKAVLNL